jgi:hypothetical protein
MKNRSKTLSLLACVSIIIVGLLVFLLKDRVFEEWYLRQFRDSSHGKYKQQALHELEMFGAEKSVIEISEYAVTVIPQVIFRYGFPGVEGNPEDPNDPPLMDWAPECMDVIQRIRDRIGVVRARSACVEYMKLPTSNIRTKVWFAQLTILLVTAHDDLPEMMRQPERTKVLLPWTPEFSQMSRFKPLAIAICAHALSTDDRYARAGAAFGLSLCGPEAKAAVSALNEAQRDSDPYVAKGAKEALRRIGGEQK